ncbi:MAG: PAS domain S-box protein, partial [Candidatus Sumerlaeota bacterium]|nr:PAS domain S-box protein [Candidatus Sumerlaeota bacterium]
MNLQQPNVSEGLGELDRLRARVRELEEALARRGPAPGGEAARETQRRYRALFDHALCGFALLEAVPTRDGQAADYAILEMNPAAERISGISAAQARGKRLSETLPSIDRERFVEMTTGAAPAQWEQFFSAFHKHLELAAYVPEQGQLVVLFIDATGRKQAEEAYRENAEELRATLEAVQVGVAWVGLDGRFLRVNPALCQMLGSSEAELLATSVQSVTLPKDWRSAEQALQSLLSGDTTVADMEVRCQPKGRRRIWAGVRARLTRDGQGEPAHFVMVVLDITDRKFTHRELFHAQERLQALVSASPVAIQVLDIEGNTLLWNPAAERIFGWTAEEAVGKPNLVVPPERRAEFEILRARVAAGESFSGVEIRRRRKDGALIDLSLSTAPLHNRAGTVVGIMGALQDITERKRQSEALRASEEKLRELFDKSPIGIEIYDADGRLVDTNRASLDLFGVSGVDQVRGFHLFSSPNVPEDIRNRFPLTEPVEYEIAFDFGKVKRHGLYPTAKSGKMHVDARITPLGPSEAATPSGYMVQVADITERKKAEEAVRLSEQRLGMAIEGARLGMWDWNVQTGEMALGGCWEEILGYAPGDIAPHFRSVRQLFHPADEPLIMEALERHLAGETPLFESEHRLLCESGEWAWGLARGKVIERDAEGNPLRMVG